MLKFYLLLFLSTINLITYAEIHVDSVYAELIRQEVSHPHIVLKQAKLESGNFKSKLTKTHNNMITTTETIIDVKDDVFVPSNGVCK